MTDKPTAGATEGHWPHPLMQFMWDFLPKSRAPANSGLREPAYATPGWMDDEISADDDVLETARAEHREGVDRAAGAEQKGHRLGQTSLAMLTLALGVAGFQISFLRDDTSGVLPVVLLTPIAFAITCLALSGIEALEVDRVGIYRPPVVAEVARTPARRTNLVDAELHASFVADWTATRKVNIVLQARAWFSRGLVLLIAGALVALGMVAARDTAKSADETPARKGQVSSAN